MLSTAHFPQQHQPGEGLLGSIFHVDFISAIHFALRIALNSLFDENVRPEKRTYFALSCTRVFISANAATSAHTPNASMDHKAVAHSFKTSH